MAKGMGGFFFIDQYKKSPFRNVREVLNPIELQRRTPIGMIYMAEEKNVKDGLYVGVSRSLITVRKKEKF